MNEKCLSYSIEKVISGIERHLGSKMDEPCADCPYFEEKDCDLKLVADTIALLKARMPRVMTVSEIGTLVNGDVVWVEFTDGRLLPMMVEDGCLMRWRFLWRICEYAFYDEDYKARAWTSCPTDEQREKVKWE